MSKNNAINVKQGDGKAPQGLVDSILKGQQLPFTVKLTHSGKKPLVVPSSGLADAIPPKTAVEVKIRSKEQAWALVTDCAAFAELCNSESAEFAVIELPVTPKLNKKPDAEGSAA